MRKVSISYVGDCGPSYHVECMIAFWLWRTLPFVLLFIGTFGNIFNIIILSRQRLRKFSTSVYILVLAITELTFLWSGLMPVTIFSITGHPFEDLSLFSCRITWYLRYTSAGSSTWVLVMMTVERMLLTKAPVFSRNKLTPRNACIVSVIVCSITAILNSHMIYGREFKTITIKSGSGSNSTAEQEKVQTSLCKFVSRSYKEFYSGIWTIFMLVVFDVVPCIIIAIGNVNIAAVLVIQRKKLAKVHPSSQTVTNQTNLERTKSSVRLLFILSAFFVMTTVPYFAYNIARGKVRARKLPSASLAKWQLLHATLFIFWCFNYAFNFFFYFLSGTLFKNEWNRLLVKAKSTVYG